MTTAIWWIRRDLRLRDNQALTQAMAHGQQVVPLFILDPGLLQSPQAGQARTTFLFESLRALDADLRTRGGRLVVCRGRPERVLTHVQQRTGATAIFAEADGSPYANTRDLPLAATLPIHFTPGRTALPIHEVRKQDGEPYVVFTPYRRQWLTKKLPTVKDILPAPTHFSVPDIIEGVKIPQGAGFPTYSAFPAGEGEAQARLQNFLRNDMKNAVYDYANQRDRMDLDSTSHLSPYLRFGMLSARTAVVGALQAVEQAPSDQSQQQAQVWLDELIWREFYAAILQHFPRVMQGSFRPEYDGIDWANDPVDFAAWCEGRTGYPIVDAAMRQLNQTGWMHNRARMIVASFLVKDLLIDWRWGERYFMQKLLDGDPAANNGGWQWAAGTGTDAAPYFRIFNPITQGEKFDPLGDYVRRYLPEVARVPSKFIHRPWTMTISDQQRAHCLIGQDYPQPIVDHSWARQRTLDAYKQAKARFPSSSG